MLTALTQPKYPKAALGLQADSISALALEGGRRQYSIRQAASVELAPGTLDPSFLETNILDPLGFAAALSEAVEAAGLMGQKRWSVALPGSAARTAILALEAEPASKQELEEVLDWKAEQSFGAPAQEMRLALEKIAPDKDGRSRYFATAVRLAVIDEYESHFESRGWQAGMILPRAVAEANWLVQGNGHADSMLISGNSEGFTALLLRGGEPAVVRSVTCAPEEVEDEIYRLVMFYNDRFAAGTGPLLERLLVIGRSLVPEKIRTIASEALGRNVSILSPSDVGLNLPGSGLTFDEIAAPSGLAALGFR
jgi:Tfp pilus assembly PilM family ATPase